MLILQPRIFYKDELMIESKLLKDLIRLSESGVLDSAYLHKMKSIKDDLIKALPDISQLKLHG